MANRGKFCQMGAFGRRIEAVVPMVLKTFKFRNSMGAPRKTASPMLIKNLEVFNRNGGVGAKSQKF